MHIRLVELKMHAINYRLRCNSHIIDADTRPIIGPISEHYKLLALAYSYTRICTNVILLSAFDERYLKLAALQGQAHMYQYALRLSIRLVACSFRQEFIVKRQGCLIAQVAQALRKKARKKLRQYSRNKK